MSVKYNFSKSVSVRICGQQHTRVHPLGSVRFFPTRQHATSAPPVRHQCNISCKYVPKRRRGPWFEKSKQSDDGGGGVRGAATAWTGTSDAESVGTRQEARWIKSIGDDVSATVSDTDGVVEERSHSACTDTFGWNAPFPRRTKKCSGIKRRDHRQFALLWNSGFLVTTLGWRQKWIQKLLCVLKKRVDAIMAGG